MGAKSQLNGGIFYIILWLRHCLQALSEIKNKKHVLENEYYTKRIAKNIKKKTKRETKERGKKKKKK
ncbi:hypothetical protein, partial [Escherichia coli]|uniref:hypothetical protein n=1 Tax=Escherichia coli TaxID=562 RepID=UPI0010CC5F03